MASNENTPITGLCVVSNPEKCPPGYELVYKTHDNKVECDLWKDGFFTKVTRYLCVTRQFPLEGGRLNNVLGDIVIINERENPYNGFANLDKTQDTYEQVTKKKIISVKMLPRATTTDAITDIIFLAKTRRAPAGYTLVGEINSLSLCYKMGRVPPETQQTPDVPHPVQQSFSQPPVPALHNNHSHRPKIERQESFLAGNALHDVPFVLGQKYQGMLQSSEFTLPELKYKTLGEIEREYNYHFSLERQAACQSL